MAEGINHFCPFWGLSILLIHLHHCLPSRLTRASLPHLQAPTCARHSGACRDQQLAEATGISQRFPLKESVSAVQTLPLPPFQPAGHPEIHLFLKVTSLACI